VNQAIIGVASVICAAIVAHLKHQLKRRHALRQQAAAALAGRQRQAAAAWRGVGPGVSRRCACWRRSGGIISVQYQRAESMKNALAHLAA